MHQHFYFSSFDKGLDRVAEGSFIPQNYPQNNPPAL